MIEFWLGFTLGLIVVPGIALAYGAAVDDSREAQRQLRSEPPEWAWPLFNRKRADA